jgi:hypothetical protein
VTSDQKISPQSSLSLTAILCGDAKTHGVVLNQEKGFTNFLPTSFHPAQDVSHYGDTGLPELLQACGATSGFGVDGRFSGDRGSQQYPSRGRFASNRSVRGRHGSPMRSKM